jgi:lipopolysaccharide export system protein LptA
MKKLLLLILLGIAAAGTVLAEKADSSKPTEITAKALFDDDVKQIRTLTGDVILKRGTLIMKAGKAVVRTDPEGYQYATFTAEAGSMATFRQKRDGGDLWVEGQAERIEYDNRTETVKLYTKAKLVRLEGKAVTEEVEGEHISYDSRKEFFQVDNSTPGQVKPPSGRVKIVIQPTNKPATPASAPAQDKQ